MPHPNRRFPLLPVLLLVLAAPLAAQDWAGRGRVQGIVLHKDTGEPIPDAKVTLNWLKGSGGGPEPLITDQKGRWSYLGLAQGGWRVVIEKEDFVPSEGQFQANEFGAGPTIKVEIRPIPEEEKVDQRAKEILGWIEQGNTYLQSKEYEAARAEYQKALAELDAANQPPILRGIARTYFEEGKSDQALDTLKQALAVQPGDVESLQLIINLLASLGRDQEARTYMEQLPEGAKVDPNAILNLGIELYNQNDLDAALVQFNRAVKENPNLADGYYYRGLVHVGQGQNEPAAADFIRFLELAPDHAQAAEARQFLEYLKPKADDPGQ